MKQLGLPVKGKILGKQRPYDYFLSGIANKVGPLYFEYRRGLLQFKSYLDANDWCTNRHNVQGPCSFFIKGYKWPFHTRRNYVGLLFPTNAATRKVDKKPF